MQNAIKLNAWSPASGHVHWALQESNGAQISSRREHLNLLERGKKGDNFSNISTYIYCKLINFKGVVGGREKYLEIQCFTNKTQFPKLETQKQY